jgi:hypothetical protein
MKTIEMEKYFTGNEDFSVILISCYFSAGYHDVFFPVYRSRLLHPGTFRAYTAAPNSKKSTG